LPELEEKIHSIEHRLYPQAINLYIQNKLKIRGRRVEII
jgi:folate-dependent phosphoribosylglycinamide formyltransferase PurN